MPKISPEVGQPFTVKIEDSNSLLQQALAFFAGP